ncbi:MAG: lactonase family protein, partial [Terriglobia bacterium]
AQSFAVKTLRPLVGHAENTAELKDNPALPISPRLRVGGVEPFGSDQGKLSEPGEGRAAQRQGLSSRSKIAISWFSKIMKLHWGLFAMLLSSLLSFAALPGEAAQASPQANDLVYVGTYTQSQSRGIYVYRFNEHTGKITPLGLAAKTTNPSFLTASPDGRYLYAINEVDTFKGQKSGAVSAFAIDPKTGKLTLLNQVASRGAGPAYVATDKTGRYVLVANYNGGNVAVFPVRKDGGLGPASAFVQDKGHSVNPARQSKPYAHSINVSPDNRFAIAADLGLDKLLVYRFDRGSLAPNDPPYATVKPGSGPRHFIFSPDGKYMYVESEMASSLTVFSYDAQRGALRPVQTVSSLPPDFRGKSTGAEVQALPSGRFLYASNRGSDSLAVFAINRRNGTLKPVEYVPAGGKTPRMFAIDPSSTYLFAANQDSDNIVIFRINKATGKLTPTGQQIKLSSPVCVVFVKTR